jgi:hypothetical protein
VKSWSDAAETFWLANVLWQCSFFFSIFALVSSYQERLLEEIRRAGESNAAMDSALRVVLISSGAEDAEKGEKETLRSSKRLMFLWQTPMMLMHYSWLTFLVGYELYLLTPLIRYRGWTVQCAVSLQSLEDLVDDADLCRALSLRRLLVCCSSRSFTSMLSRQRRP